jgi:hypothetical protein
VTPLDTLLKQVAQLRPVDPTECVDEPEFDPGRLLAWQAGAEDEDAVRHLGACAACRTLLAGLEPLSEAAVERAVAEVVEPVAVADAPSRPPVVAAQEDKRPPTPPRRWVPWLLLPSATLAAAAATVVTLAGRHLPPPPAVYGDEVTGGVKTSRSTTAPAGHVFLPHSRLRWVIRPWTAVTPAPQARVFRVEGDRLVALPPELVRVQEGGTVVVEGPGAQLLGEKAARVVLLVALAWEIEALDRLADAPLGQALESIEVSVFQAEFDYRLAP